MSFGVIRPVRQILELREGFLLELQGDADVAGPHFFVLSECLLSGYVIQMVVIRSAAFSPLFLAAPTLDKRVTLG